MQSINKIQIGLSYLTKKYVEIYISSLHKHNLFFWVKDTFKLQNT